MDRTWSIRGAMAMVASFLVVGLFAVPAGATTYTVTSTSLCGGAGTFEQALKDANANPGTDTISFTPGLVVDAHSCTTPTPPTFPFATSATESVTIVGNGVTVEGNQLYTAGNGQVNVPGTCPTHDATTTQMFDEPGLLPTPVTVAVTDHPVTNISRSPSPIRDRCHAPHMRLKRGSRTLVPAADMGLCQK